jgi:hypothetical protein
METGISDIQKIADDKIQITFCVYPSCEDFMTLTLDKKTMWEIKEFCENHLSYKAQLKAKKK